MAVGMRLPVSMGGVFPNGAFVVGEVSAVENFERKQSGQGDPQERDKETGLRLWAVRVVDTDPDARKGQSEVVVKVAAEVQPVPPDLLPGLPFRPVEFDGLTITPWVDESRERPRVAYSVRATGMRAPAKSVRAVPGRD